VVFPKNYSGGLAKYIVPNSFVVVKGRLSARDIETELLAENIMSIEEARRFLPAFISKVRLKINSAGLEQELLGKIKKVINAHPGTSPVVLDVSTPQHAEYSIETGYGVASNQKFLNEIEKLLGQDSVQLEVA